MKKTLFERVISLVICIAMLLPMTTVFPFSFVTSASASDVETSTETTYLDGVHYYIDKSISYIGNRSFQLDVKLHTTLTDTDIVLNRNYARNGYFTVQISGWYLLELWGGAGADGEDVRDFVITRYGGEGGSKGYVYAKVYLSEGQTLAYSIGTDGAQTIYSGTGGGVNGSGGDRGDGSKKVGAGGGYSALYFFDEGEFDPSWLQANGTWSMPASVRLSRYVMIAAGGGGGGAGNGLAWGNATGANGIQYANGGAGGNINNGVSMRLNGAGGSVAGYLFFGKNGQSSGTSSAYVGRGGTNLPGSCPSTSGGIYTAEPGPNDWSGAYSLDSTPGAGGMGMFRGGGGGAGFCGGSGGIMYGQAVANHVGGGGGGSSFLASTVGGNDVYFGKNEVEESKLHGANGCPSDVGGAFSYTFLGNNGDEEINTSYLTNVTVQGKLSQYFDVYANPSTNGDTTPNGELIYNAETGSFTVTGANIDASSVERDGTVLSMSFMIRAKTAFIGGNNVPLLESLSISMDCGASEPTAISSEGNERTDRVNVPLSLSIPTNSKMISFKEGDEAPTFKMADLYVNEHTAANTNTSTAGWAYDFVKSVDSPAIYTGNKGTGGTRYTAANTPAITETTYYSVTMKVTPKTDGGYAACGPKSESAETFVGIITITVLDATIFGGEDGWSYDLTTNKTLSQQDDYFIFEQSVTQSLTRQYTLTSTAVYSGSSNYSTSSFPVEKSGYYLLQAWGANGGKGQDSTVRTKGGTSSATGGSGGSGAAVYVFAYLEAGDVIHFTLGKNGTGYYSTATNSNSSSTCTSNLGVSGSPGTGGYASAIALQKSGMAPEDASYILVAGGGGGGGASAVARGGEQEWNKSSTSGSKGLSGSSSFNYTGEFTGDLSAFKGETGKTASFSLGALSNQGIVSTSGGSPAASAGQNYCDSVYANVGKSDEETLYLSRLASTLAVSSDFQKPTSSSYGAARISFICDDETTVDLKQFPGVEVGGTFSRYFEVPRDENGIPMLDMSLTGVVYDSKETVANDDGSFTVTYYERDILSAQFSFTLNEENSITSYDVYGTVYHPTFRVSKVDSSTYIADCGFSILISLTPREGFLGGNDVPVLDGLSDGDDYTNVYVMKGETKGYLRADDKADYVNVPITYDVASHFMVKEGYAILGDDNAENDTVSITDLYTLDIDLSSYADWQKEFVRLCYPEETAQNLSYTLSSFTQQWVSLTAGLVPTVPAEDAKAVVSGDNGGSCVELYTWIYAQYPIICNLSNVNCSGDQFVTYGRDTTVRLTACDGFLLPKEADVSVKNEWGSNINFTYVEASGLLEIPSMNYLYSPVIVTAEAKPLPFKLHYVFSLDGTTSDEVVENYNAGETIDPTFIDTFLDVYNVKEREGYTFTWEWETDDGLRPEVMPGNDLWVIGGYKKNLYDLTISYVDAANNEIAPAHTEVLEYGAAFSIPSPAVEGFMPDSASINGADTDPFVISGSVGTRDISVTVRYIGANNRLVILYLYPDGSEFSRFEDTLTDGQSFDVSSPSIVDGYEPDRAFINGESWNDPTRVSGTMPAGGSIIAHVYYKPVVYEVELEYRYDGDTYPKPNGSTLSYDLTQAVLDNGSDKLYIEYGNVFGYNRETDSYGLPTPIVAGYTFAGWYTDTSFTEQVTEDRIVTQSNPTTLYAKWEPQLYKLIIRFDFVLGQYHVPDISCLPTGTRMMDENGDGVAEYYYLQLEYFLEESYSVTLDPMIGYTPYLEYGISGVEVPVDVIKGEMPPFNRLYDVTYEINSYLIRFFAYGGIKNVTFPTYTSYMQEEGPFTDDLQLTEAVYEYAEPVIYPEDTLNQTRKDYTFVPDYWESSEGVKYLNDLTATMDADLYAHYYAHENIATVYKYNGTDVVSHHYRIEDALATALSISNVTNESEAPIVRLHRHEDVADRDIYLNETVVFGDGATSKMVVRLDLAGISLKATETAIEVRDASLYICNSSDTPAYITVESTGDTVAIGQTGKGDLAVGSSWSNYAGPLTVQAVSDNGDATCVYATGNDCKLYHYSGEMIADARTGNAFGILQELSYLPHESNSSLIIYGSILSKAENDAYAVKTNVSLKLYSSSELKAESEKGTAVGIEGGGRLDLDSGSNSSVAAHSAEGNAIGIYSTYRILYGVNYAPGLSVEASSDNGDATAIIVTTVYSGSMSNTTATAIAPSGKAIALKYLEGTSSVTINSSVTLCAEGREAIGFAPSAGSFIYATIAAVGTESAIAVYSPVSLAELCEAVNILAESPTGNAYAIYGGTTVAYSYKMSNGGTVLAKTDSGNAYALYNCSVTGNLCAVTVSAEATGIGNAYGFYVGEGVNSNLCLSDNSITSNAPLGNAYGAFVAGEATLHGTLSVMGQNAYGVFVSGTVTELDNTVTVSGSENAYGIAVVGGKVITPQNSFTVNVTTTDGTAYGLYAANSGKIGGAPIAESLWVGKVSATATGAGIGYGLYAESGNIYITGDTFYYKGSDDSTRREGNGVVIAAGFVEVRLEDTDENYPGYYYLKVQGRYTITFVGYSFEGEEIDGYAYTFEYIPGKGFVNPENPSIPTAPASPFDGYESVWEEYDFSAPDDVPEIPVEGVTYDKVVRSIYVARTFQLTFAYNDNNNETVTVPYTYGEEIILPQMGTREKLGHVFSGTWERYDDITDNWTMPAYDLTVSAVWDRDYFVITVMTGGIEMSFSASDGDIEILESTKDKVVIRGQYNTYLDYTYVMPGYTLDGFYLDEAFTQPCGTTSIPAQNVTVYAHWIESLSVVIMGPFGSYDVMVNIWLDKNGDGLMDENETIPYDTLEGLFGAEEGEKFFHPTEDNPICMLPITEMCLIPYFYEESLGDMIYRVVGWYTPDGRTINVASGIGSWGITPDANGYTNIYVRLEEFPTDIGSLQDPILQGSFINIPYSNPIFNQHFTYLLATQTSAAQDGSDTGGYTYTTYKAVTTGEYLFYMCETGKLGYYTQFEITLCKQDGTKAVILSGEEGKFEHKIQSVLAITNESDFYQLRVDMEAGDTLLIRTNQLPNENGEFESSSTAILAKVPGLSASLYELTGNDEYIQQNNNVVGKIPPVLEFYLMMHNATDFFFYGRSMGEIELPVDSMSNDNPAFDNVVGWAVSDETMQPTDKVITSVTPELVDDPSLWLDMDGMALLFLLPEITEEPENPLGESWLGTIAAGRHFDTGELKDPSRVSASVALHDTADVTLIFAAEMSTTGQTATLFFTTGLPAGTTLMLVDLSVQQPIYYYYVITEQDVSNRVNKYLSLDHFTMSGGGGAFSGCSDKMLLQICYPEGKVPASESIGIGFGTEPSAFKASFTATATNEQTLNDLTPEDNEVLEQPLRIPNLTNRSYGKEDTFALILRLYDEEGKAVKLPAGFISKVGEDAVKLYSDFAYISLGRVKDYNGAFNLSVETHLTALRYFGFSGTAVYELVVLPAGTDISHAVLDGTGVKVDTRVNCGLTVSETPAIVIGDSHITASRGESITLSAYIEGFEEEEREIELYILRREGSKMVYKPECEALLLLGPDSFVPVDESGRVPFTLYTGTGSFTISEEAETGIYFIVVYHHGRYKVCILNVTE